MCFRYPNKTPETVFVFRGKDFSFVRGSKNEQ